MAFCPGNVFKLSAFSNLRLEIDLFFSLLNRTRNEYDLVVGYVSCSVSLQVYSVNFVWLGTALF